MTGGQDNQIDHSDFATIIGPAYQVPSQVQ